MPMADTPVVQDQGILISDDIVAIEQASWDLINSSPPLPQSAASDINLKMGDKIMEEIHPKNAQLQIDTAANLGLGSKDYELIEIEKKGE